MAVDFDHQLTKLWRFGSVGRADLSTDGDRNGGEPVTGQPLGAELPRNCNLQISLALDFATAMTTPMSSTPSNATAAIPRVMALPPEVLTEPDAERGDEDFHFGLGISSFPWSRLILNRAACRGCGRSLNGGRRRLWSCGVKAEGHVARGGPAASVGRKPTERRSCRPMAAGEWRRAGGRALRAPGRCRRRGRASRLGAASGASRVPAS